MSCSIDDLHRDVESSPAPALERALLSAAQGDQKGFARLVQHYQHDVYSRCMWYLADPERAKEASQETFLRLHKAILQNTFAEGEHHLRGWLRRVATHVSIEQQRSASARIKKLWRLFSLQDPTPHTSPAFARIELQETFRALYQLHESQRNALIMSVFDGFSNAEIADALGKSEKAIEQLLVRARRQLRQELEK